MSGTTPCPDWCESSLGIEESSGHDGPTWPSVADSAIGEAWHGAQISAGMEGGGELRVYIDSRDPCLTPAQAREVARHLTEAAAWVEDHSRVTV